MRSPNKSTDAEDDVEAVGVEFQPDEEAYELAVGALESE